MAEIESIDGKKYNVPDDVLARYRIGEETVGKLLQHDELPVAPPPQTGWDNYGMEEMMRPPMPQQNSLENNPFVHVQRGEGNNLIINVVIPGAQ